MKNRNYFSIGLIIYIIVCVPLLLFAQVQDFTLATTLSLTFAPAIVTSVSVSYCEMKSAKKQRSIRKKEKEVLQFICPLLTGSGIVGIMHMIISMESMGEFEKIVCIGSVIVIFGALAWYYRKL